MASSKLSKDGTGEKCVGTYDAERFLTEKEASKIDWKNGIRILIIGKTGEGKSATGNTMMGQKWFESDSCSKSVTQKGKTGRMKWKNQHIKIVDTPGFCDNRMSEKDFKLEMIKCMTLILPGPHIIMYVIRIGRYTDEDIEVADKFLQILDENPYKHIIIVLTGRDDLEYHCKSPKTYLETVPSNFKSLAKKCGQRCIFINNRSKDNKGEWIEMYSAIDVMLVKSKRSYYTSRLLMKLDEAFGQVLAQHRLVETSITKEQLIACLEKEIEKEGGILYKLFNNVAVGALTCGIFTGIIALSAPIGVGGALIGAGGAAVHVGGKHVIQKYCSIS